MGDRLEWTQKCPKCGVDIEVWYAESCGVTTVTCRKCLTLFNIVMGFRLVESSGERPAPTEEERLGMLGCLSRLEQCDHYKLETICGKPMIIICERDMKLIQKIRALILSPPEPVKAVDRERVRWFVKEKTLLSPAQESIFTDLIWTAFCEFGIAVEDEPGGQGETKRKEGKMSDQEAAINIARDAYCGERPEDEHEDR